MVRSISEHGAVYQHSGSARHREVMNIMVLGVVHSVGVEPLHTVSGDEEHARDNLRDDIKRVTQRDSDALAPGTRCLAVVCAPNKARLFTQSLTGASCLHLCSYFHLICTFL